MFTLFNRLQYTKYNIRNSAAKRAIKYHQLTIIIVLYATTALLL